jgi:hypothetical protein
LRSAYIPIAHVKAQSEEQRWLTDNHRHEAINMV